MTTPISHLVVTPCPTGKTGVGGNTAQVSVLLAPRLRDPGVLTDYADFRDWGTKVANLKFRVFNGNNMVTVGGGANPPPLAVTVKSPAVDPDVWAAVFGDSTGEWNKVTVEPAAFIDRTSTSFTSVDAAGLASTTSALYAALAKLGTGQPTKGDVQTAGAAALGAPLTSARTFMAPIGNGNTPADQDYEFHQILRVASAHPYLMRQLGLVFDLEFDLSSAPPGLAEVQIRTNWPSFGNTESDFRDRHQVPLRMRIDSKFEPLVAATQYRTGRWLALGGSKYAVTQGSAVAVGQALDNVSRQLGDAAGAATPVQVPALPDGGLSVVHTEVVSLLVNNLARARALEDDTDHWILNSPPGSLPPLIYAEDATAGTRWDVKDVSKGVFRSLHQRRVPNGYDFPRDAGLSVTPPDDEGWSTLAISTDGTAAFAPRATPVRYDDVLDKIERRDDTDWRVNADQMTWSGWSLSARKPGRIINGEGAVTDPSANTPQADDPAQVIVDYRVVPGTLERLRFNHTYSFRGRCVDLAGNSLPLSTVEPAGTPSPNITYGRMAPVPPPTVVRRQSRPDPGVGDLVDVLVIKSELLQSNAATPTTDRMFFVPAIAQDRLEHHGLPAADGIDVADYSFIATRDAKTLANQLLVDPETGESVAGAAVVGNTVTAGALKQKAQYLPDPVAAKVAFHGLPKGGKTPKQVAVGTWPDPESVALVLKAGSGSPSVSATNRTVTAQLPKGTVVTCEVSSSIDAKYLDHMKWFQVLSAADKNKVRTAAKNGQVRILSPRKTLTLVHAVRVPLLAPSFGPFTATRTQVGQTTVTLGGTMKIHRGTMERIVIGCKWEMSEFDAIAAPTSGVVTDRTVAPTGVLLAETLSGLTFDFGDTKRRTVTLDAEAFCRFSSYFTERKDTSGTQGAAILLNAAGVVQESVSVARLSNGVAFAPGVDFTVNPDAGTVTPKPSGGIANGTLLRIQYIPRPVSRRSSEAKTGKTFVFTVPSSAPPRRPDVRHVIPAFSRTVKATATQIVITHDGRVVRVVMDRGWFSSGEGELLGVAIDKASVTTPVLTRWGRDPLTTGTGATVRPSTASFKKAVATAANVDGKFDVAAHAVVPDDVRDVLTSDIQVAAVFGYRPFVQLHLCRYQPVSLAGQATSTFVATETLRLGAPRVVTAKKKAGHTVEVKLVGPDRVNVVTVTLQEADPTVSDPDLRWTDAAQAPVVLTRTGTTTLATHTGTIATPVTGKLRRLIVEDAEPVSRDVAGVLTAGTEVAYREVIELPAAW